MGCTFWKEKLEQTWFLRVGLSFFILPNMLPINSIPLKLSELYFRDLGWGFPYTHHEFYLRKCEISLKWKVCIYFKYESFQLGQSHRHSEQAGVWWQPWESCRGVSRRDSRRLWGLKACRGCFTGMRWPTGKGFLGLNLQSCVQSPKVLPAASPSVGTAQEDAGADFRHSTACTTKCYRRAFYRKGKNTRWGAEECLSSCF